MFINPLSIAPQKIQKYMSFKDISISPFLKIKVTKTIITPPIKLTGIMSTSLNFLRIKRNNEKFIAHPNANRFPK